MEQNLSFKNSYSNEKLIEEYKKGNETAFEVLYENNKGLLYSIVRRFNKYDFDDIYQIACLAFMKAILRFDSNYEVKFTTYLVPVVIGEIKRYFRDHNSIHISRSLKENYILIKEETNKYIVENGSEPTPYELSIICKLSIEDIILSLEANQFVYSLDLYEYKSKETDLNLTYSIETEFNKLNEFEKKIIDYRYFKSYKQKEVALLLNISQVQVSRIEKRILLKLREKFEI